jgi:hypothetical protein
MMLTITWRAAGGEAFAEDVELPEEGSTLDVQGDEGQFVTAEVVTAWCKAGKLVRVILRVPGGEQMKSLPGLTLS